jgi:molecular chaperone GrpE
MSRSESETKHSLQVDISEELIHEALRAVEGHASAGAAKESSEVAGGEAAAASGPAVEGAAPAGDAVEILPAVDASADAAEEPIAADEAAEAAAAAAEARPEVDEVAALREELALKERLLEESAERMQQLMQRLQEANDLRLRAVADLENFKKRAAREREEVQKFGIEKLLTELLPVLDNLDRALEAADGATDVRSFAEGVRMNRRLFEETLGKFGVESFTAVGKPFDPRYHEALQQVESREFAPNVVVQEVVRGYLLHERLVRPALVIVSGGPGPEDSSEHTTADG